MDVESTQRMLASEEVATYLGIEDKRFIEIRRSLESHGFPRPFSFFGRWDKIAIDAWLDAAGGIDNQKESPVPRPFINPFNRCPPPEPPKHPPLRGRPGYTVAKVLGEYTDSFMGTAHTLRNTIYYINAEITPAFGHRKVTSLKADEIRSWHKRLAERPKKIKSGFGKPVQYSKDPIDEEGRRRRQSSANRVLSILKAALNRAYREGKIPSDDAWRRVQSFRRVSIGKGGYLIPEQCVALVKYCAPDFRRLAQAALFTGARFGELTNLTANDFDEQAGTVFISKAKYLRSRHVALTEEGMVFFRALTTGCCPSQILLLRGDGKPWHPTDPYPRLESACQLAGISPRVTFHQLRHTYASILAMNGTPMAVIAKNLGHTTSEPCEKYYAHLSPSYVSETIRKRMPRLGILETEG